MARSSSSAASASAAAGVFSLPLAGGTSGRKRGSAGGGDAPGRPIVAYIVWLAQACVWAFVGAALWSFAPADWPTHAVFPQNRRLPLRVRLLIDYLRGSFGRPDYWRGA